MYIVDTSCGNAGDSVEYAYMKPLIELLQRTTPQGAGQWTVRIVILLVAAFFLASILGNLVSPALSIIVIVAVPVIVFLWAADSDNRGKQTQQSKQPSKKPLSKEEVETVMSENIQGFLIKKKKWYLEQRIDYRSAVMKRDKELGLGGHVSFLFASIFTLGILFPLWILVIIFDRQKRLLLRVDEYGQATERKI